jgi:prepilin-type N-terminal cleavage/methylation domain-containing protein
MKQINLLQQKIRSGFTLVETLVAIFILSLVLVPALYIAYQGVGSAIYSREQMVANYLAQDAMDFILAKKNENIMHCETPANVDGDPESKNCNSSNDGIGKDWLADMRDCVGRNCYINTTQTALGGEFTRICTSGVCEPLKYDEASGRYSHSSGVSSDYTRTVRFEQISNTGGDGVEVSVIVDWKGSSFRANNKLTLRTTMFNFKP